MKVIGLYIIISFSETVRSLRDDINPNVLLIPGINLKVPKLIVHDPRVKRIIHGKLKYESMPNVDRVNKFNDAVKWASQQDNEQPAGWYSYIIWISLIVVVIIIGVVIWMYFKSNANKSSKHRRHRHRDDYSSGDDDQTDFSQDER